MINRIVRMSFQPENVDVFLRVFNESKNYIANFDGCKSLELFCDVNQKNVFFTYSTWENEISLDAYRNSELFLNTWAQTKILFNDKPLAWSTFIIDKVK